MTNLFNNVCKAGFGVSRLNGAVWRRELVIEPVSGLARAIGFIMTVETH